MHVPRGPGVPQVVEAEVLDAGAPFRLVPGGRTLLNALTGKGEAPPWVLSPRRFERRRGVRIERYTATVTRLRRTVIEPRDLPVKIYAAPFEPQDLARTAAGRERELHDRLHVVWQRLDQSVSYEPPDNRFERSRRQAKVWARLASPIAFLCYLGSFLDEPAFANPLQFNIFCREGLQPWRNLIRALLLPTPSNRLPII